MHETYIPLDPKSCRIGIPAMDEQHAKWITIIEGFKSAASGHLLDESSRNAAVVALEKLLDYTLMHFTSEEKFLESHAYPGLGHHRRRHEELEVTIRKLLAEAREHKLESTPLKLNLLITIWLMEHIMKDDLAYATHILERERTQNAMKAPGRNGR